MKKVFIVLVFGIALQGLADLPEAARQEQRRLQQLEAAAEKYPSFFIRNVNTDARLLSRLDVVDPIRVTGETVFSLPDDLVPLLPFFDGIVFQTQGGSFDVFWKNGEEDKLLNNWWGGNRGKFACRLPSQQSYSGAFNLVIKGSGKIESVSLLNPKGISLEFDAEPWGVPGSGEPVQNIEVLLDATTRFSIGGVSGFDRTKYMRVYGLADGPDDFQKAAKYFTSKGWTISRDAGKSLLKWGREKPPRSRQLQRVRELYPENPGEVFCFSEWPESMGPEDPMLPVGTGTPAVDQFDAAAQLAAKVIKNRQLAMEEFAGPWCEVKNESDIAANWAYFSNPKKYDAWKLLADFHNVVAAAVKSENPGWKVGGPSSCMPSVDSDGFQRGKEMLTFMDRTHESLDYYSLHFYERENFRLLSERNHHTYLFGRLEGILDLFRNKMALQGDVKPILVTEYGGSRSLATDVGYWKFIRSASSLMMRFMQYPDCIEMSVPFVIPIAFHSKRDDQPLNDSFQLFVYDEDRNMQLTNLRYFLDLWSDFQGERIVSKSNADGVTVNALRAGRVVYLAVNNLSQKRISVNVKGVFGEAVPTKIEQIRLYMERGQLVFRKDSLFDLTEVPLAFDETSIVKIILDQNPGVVGELSRQIFFADKIMQPTGRNVNFSISCPTEGISAGLIRIALGRNNGFPSDLKVSLNGGSPISVSLEASRKSGMYYGTVEIPVDVSKLRPVNVIAVDSSDVGGKITSVVLENEYQLNDTGK